MNIQQKNKVLVVHSSAGDDAANFRVNFHEPVVFPPDSQVRLINCRLNLDDNEVLVNDSNNSFQWGLGYAWSDEENGSGGSCGLFDAFIEPGNYINAAGTTSEFITFALERAFNNSVSNMTYLRGGFSVSIAGGKITVKLSKCTVPTIVNGSATSSKWHDMNQVGTAVPVTTSRQEIQNSVNDLTGAGGYNGCKFLLNNTTQQGANEEYTAFVSENVISGLSNTDGTNPVALFQLDLNKVLAPTGDAGLLHETTFGLTPERCSGRGFNGNEESLEDEGWEPQENLLVLPNGTHVNATISFAYDREDRFLHILEGDVNDLALFMEDDDPLVNIKILRTVECATIMNKILQVRVFLLEPTGIPAPNGDSPLYQYRVVVDITDGTALPGGAYDVTRNIPQYMYRIPNRGDGKFLTNDFHADNPSGLCAFVTTAGKVVEDDHDAFFATCAFDTHNNYVTRSVHVPHQPLVLFGEPLNQTTRRSVEQNYGPFNSVFYDYNPARQTVGLALGFNNDELVLGGNGTSFAPGVTLPQAVSTARSDQAAYYLVMDDLPVHNYTGNKANGRPNKIVGLITLKTRADDLYYPSENKTQLYVDLHNLGQLQYNSLSFRICDKEGRTVQDCYNNTILTLEVRQNPNVALRQMFLEMAGMMKTNVRADYKASGNMLTPNSMGQ